MTLRCDVRVSSGTPDEGRRGQTRAEETEKVGGRLHGVVTLHPGRLARTKLTQHSPE